MDKEDYIDFINNKIELSKLLNLVEPQNRKNVEELFYKKKEIIQKNGLLANFKLKQINKKIAKYKKY